MIYNSFTPADETAFNTWYEGEYVPSLKEVPGWTRTRRYKLEDVARVGYEKDKYPQPPTYIEVSGKFLLSRAAVFFFHYERLFDLRLRMNDIEFETLAALRDPKYPKDTAGHEVISSATATERRVFKLYESYEPTAALKALRTPAASTPAFEFDDEHK